MMSTWARASGWAAVFLAALSWGGRLRAELNGADAMYLTVTEYEAGISFRDVQKHAPIGMIANPCSYADSLVPTIDWNDGKGEHKPDTNLVTTLFQKVTPVTQSGVYLFWDDTHRFEQAGTTTVTTRLVAHCLGDPPGDRIFVSRQVVHAYARVPVNQVLFERAGKEIETVKGHDSVDVSITLDAPAPPSGTWVKLETVPPSSLNSLPPFFLVPPQQSQAIVMDLETRKPASNTNLVIRASTVGRPQETGTLVITPQ
jgi:hypothetical protein